MYVAVQVAVKPQARRFTRRSRCAANVENHGFVYIGVRSWRNDARRWPATPNRSPATTGQTTAEQRPMLKMTSHTKVYAFCIAGDTLPLLSLSIFLPRLQRTDRDDTTNIHRLSVSLSL